MMITENSIAGIADWVELSLLFEKEFISKSFIENELTRNSITMNEQVIDDIFTELEKRLEFYGLPVPYILENEIIKRKIEWNKRPDLAMCIFLNYFGAANESKATKLFERISNEAVKTYIDGESYLMGFPNDEGLKENIKEVAKKSNEKLGNISELRPTDKDREVDIIAWKSFEDKRPGQIVLLVQCASGKHWQNKKSIPNQWNDYILWASKYLTGLTISEIITDINILFRHSRDQYGIIFDRARLYRLISQKELNNELNEKIVEWCKNKFDNLN